MPCSPFVLHCWARLWLGLVLCKGSSWHFMAFRAAKSPRSVVCQEFPLCFAKPGQRDFLVHNSGTFCSPRVAVCQETTLHSGVQQHYTKALHPGKPQFSHLCSSACQHPYYPIYQWSPTFLAPQSFTPLPCRLRSLLPNRPQTIISLWPRGWETPAIHQPS